MKTYNMTEANGAAIGVSSTAEAHQVMAGFEPFANKFLAEIDPVTSVNAELFAFLQRVAVRWDTNCKVLRDIEADDDLMLAEKKKTEKERATAIRDMARKCRETSKGLAGH